jgi:hypothetical protein
MSIIFLFWINLFDNITYLNLHFYIIYIHIKLEIISLNGYYSKNIKNSFFNVKKLF